jgi:PAS domain S-box-containing protein
LHLTERRTENILIVEDEGLIAADVQRKLQRLGYPVPAVAQSGVEAIRLARSTPFVLVLMDIRLQGDTDGIATAQALKDEFATPVVYMTAHADQETISRAKLTEPLGYVIKPVTDGDLSSTVQISLYRHRMERRVRLSEAWLSATLRSVGDGIVATDTTGEIVFINPVAEELTGWCAADAHGRLLMEILALAEESRGQPAKNPVFNLIPGVPGDSRCYRLTRKNGAEIVVEVQCFENRAPATSMPQTPPRAAAKSRRPDAISGGQAAGISNELLGTIVVFRDCAARRQMEARLLQAQRMEAVANMAGGLAHDFNNQLTVILGYAGELGAQVEGEDKEAALKIKQAACVAASITSQLLVLSRRSETRFEELNVNEVVCEMQPMISHCLGKTRTLETDLGSPPGWVRCDRNQLKQVLLNLALNARDAMPGEGTLRIETCIAEVDSESRDARVDHPGQYVRLRVSDTGSGMNEATLARIFEPFFTTKKAGSGTGLGLSMVHSIIVQSGGYIGAESEIGRGTTFEILLPCVRAFRRISEISGVEDSSGDDPAPTVLLVEDDDSVRRMMHSFLEREGYQLLEAENAEEAEDLAELYEGSIHVLVSDVMMPGMTGPELAARLMPLRPEMKTLFVSGYPHDTLERLGLSKGDLNLLSKPFPAAELVQRIQMLLTQGVRTRVQ